MTLILASAPDVEPLTAADVRDRLNIGADVSDAALAAFITAARQMIDGKDGWIGRSLITQTWNLVLDRFPGGWWNANLPASKGFYPEDYSGYYQHHQHFRQGIVIPLPPLQEVMSVKYQDADNVQQTLDSATYQVLIGEPSHIVLADGAAWPPTLQCHGSVIVQFLAGYGDAGTDVPETIRMAIALQVSHLRSLSAQNLFLRSETVQGVGSQDWALSANAGDVINGAVMALLTPYRVWTP